MQSTVRKVNSKIQIRHNELGIQMIPGYLRENIFGNLLSLSKLTSKTKLEESKYHLYKNNLWKKKLSNYENKYYASKTIDQPLFPIPDVDIKPFRLPKLNGRNVEEHFFNIGKNYSEPYKQLIEKAIHNEFPKMPDKWSFTPGWTKYELVDNEVNW